MPKTQVNSFVSLSTPLGPEVLLLESLSGVEGVSRLFRFELELLSEDFEVAFNKLIGQPVAVRIDVPAMAEPRYLHGHISRFEQLRNKNGLARYRAELVPWLWFLTQTTDCRIFQRKRVHEIIEQVCKDNGHRDVRSDLDGDYAKLDYCVQYRETDFAFVSRLMEHFGISYYFEHSKDKHVLVLVDSLTRFPECPDQKQLRYNEDAQRAGRIEEAGIVTDLRIRQEVRPGKFTHRDYNFERPQQMLEAASKGTLKVSHPAYEIYDHPGRFVTRDAGESLARLRMQAIEAKYLLVSGTSTSRACRAGYTFELSEHPRTDANTKYLPLEVTHDLCAGGYTDDPPRYENQFSCIPVKGQGAAPLRPARLSPWPRVEGPQTAVVVGESGEEIYTDKHGRIKVQFHWDREGKNNEESSCWVRVSQGYSGKGFGALFLPRIGQEVIVDFLEGDPDQPIVTGAVYNGQQTPPYPLPAERSKSTIKTNTYKGDGYNELRFEDKAGSEEIFLHAQKNLNEVIENDHSTNVAGNQSLDVKKTLTENVGSDRKETVKNNHTQTVGNDRTESVGGSMSLSVSKSLSEVVEKSRSESVGESMTVAVGASLTESVEKGRTLSVGEADNESVGKNRNTSIGGDLTLAVEGKGTQTYQKELLLSSRKKLVIEAEDEIVLKVGDAKLVLKKNGDVSLKGGKINVNASGNLAMKGSKIMQN